MKKLLKFFGFICLVFVVLIGIAVTIVYIKEEAIYSYAIAELNASQEGKTEIETVKLDLFTNFPYISVDLKKLTFYPSDLDTVPIYHFDDVYVGFDLWDILKGEITIKKILIQNGFVHLEKDENGKLNLLLAKAGKEVHESIEEETNVHLDLQSISLKNIQLTELSTYQEDKYIAAQINDLKLKFSSIQNNLDVELQTDFILEAYKVEALYLLKNKKMSLNTVLHLDLATDFLSIDESILRIENSKFVVSGTVDIANDVDLNIEIHGRKENFDLLFAFAPPEILENLNQFRNEGQIFFDGYVKGKVAIENPSLNFEFGCVNTVFAHRLNQKSLKEFQFNGRFSSGEDNQIESYEFSISNLYGVPETGQLKGTFKVKNFINPQFSVDFHTTLDLENLKTFYDTDLIEYSTGQVIIDITVNEFVGEDSLIHMATKLDNGTNSRVVFKAARFKFKDYPHEIKDINGRLELDGDDLVLKKLDAEILDSDVHFDFKLNNLIAIVHEQNLPIELFFHVFGEKLNFNQLLPPAQLVAHELLAQEEITDYDIKLDFKSDRSSLLDFEYYPYFDLNIHNIKFKAKKYPHKIQHLNGDFYFTKEKISVDDFNFKIGRNDFHLYLDVLNPKALMSERKEKVNFTLKTKAAYLNLKELLVYNDQLLINEDIAKELEKEIIQNFTLDSEGNFVSNSFEENGFFSRLTINDLGFKFNELPQLKNTKGKIRTDTTGCIYVDNLSLQIGKSDFVLDVEMKDYLYKGDKNQLIKGSLKGNNWDFDNLLSYQKPVATDSAVIKSHEDAVNIFVFPFPNAQIKLAANKINYHKYLLQDFKGQIRTTPDHYIYVDTLKFLAADGVVDFKGYFNGSNPNEIYLHSDLVLTHLDMDKVLFKLDNFGNEYALNENFKGILDAKVSSKVHLFEDFEVDLAKTNAHIEFTLKDGAIKNFGPMHAMAEFMGNNNLDDIRFATLENTLDYNNGKVSIPQMKIASTLGYLYLSGSHDANNDMDYTFTLPLSMIKGVSINMMKTKLGMKNKKEADKLKDAEEEIITDQKGIIKKYMEVKMKGNMDDEEWNIKVGGIKRNP